MYYIVLKEKNIIVYHEDELFILVNHIKLNLLWFNITFSRF
jgi:hypothetical protein